MNSIKPYLACYVTNAVHGLAAGYLLYGLICGADPQKAALVIAVSSVAFKAINHLLAFLMEPKKTSEKLNLVIITTMAGMALQTPLCRHYNIIGQRGTNVYITICMIAVSFFAYAKNKVEEYEKNQPTQQSMAFEKRMLDLYDVYLK